MAEKIEKRTISCPICNKRHIYEFVVEPPSLVLTSIKESPGFKLYCKTKGKQEQWFIFEPKRSGGGGGGGGFSIKGPLGISRQHIHHYAPVDEDQDGNL